MEHVLYTKCMQLFSGTNIIRKYMFQINKLLCDQIVIPARKLLCYISITFLHLQTH